jgi:hypothetical protein
MGSGKAGREIGPSTIVALDWASAALARVVGPLPRVLGRPVRHLALLLWDMVAAVGVGLERHRGFRIRQGASSYPNTPPIPTADPCNTAAKRVSSCLAPE